MEQYTAALAGNPNVGKSTVFNTLTGMRQHTGNWPGKTVAVAEGAYTWQGAAFRLIDLPGTYSLRADSPEEQIARDFICGGGADVTVLVADATCLRRNLHLAVQLRCRTPRLVVCVNLMDEARRKGVAVDVDALSRGLDAPVVTAAARSGQGMDDLRTAVLDMARREPWEDTWPPLDGDDSAAVARRASAIADACLSRRPEEVHTRDRRLDRVLTGWGGVPVMLLLLGAVLWLTIWGANRPSELLSRWLMSAQEPLRALLGGAPWWLRESLVDGVYRTAAWVVAVMLPPMAIFFPLFTLLEDSGYLPRIAYNLDKPFKSCHACGKQALTMCMGFGCNAAGIVGCRIIDSPRERLIAMITNNFVPCNGRFPTLIAIITMFFVGVSGGAFDSFLSALLLTVFIVLGVFMTFAASKFLSMTVLKGIPSSFTLELPPYRRPQIGKVIVRSIFDRTLFVLGRAIVVAAPAGLLIWVMANVQVGGLTLLAHCSGFLDPFARLLGMDGVILMAFILGLPANEIVIPIIIMAYMAQGSILEFDSLAQLKELLVNNGWTWITAVSTMLFSLMHWPCTTTLLTIRKESGSFKWTLVSFLVPTVCGIVICFAFTCVAGMFV